MAQSDLPPQEPLTAADNNTRQSLWRRMFGQNGAGGDCDLSRTDTVMEPQELEDDQRPGLIRRVSRKVVPGLPRAQTFKRQQSELRTKLEPVQPTPAERRAVSVDRRLHSSQLGSQCQSEPRASAPDFAHDDTLTGHPFVPSLPTSPNRGDFRRSLDDVQAAVGVVNDDHHMHDTASIADAASMTTSQYDTMIHEELETKWILNLSMHFRDKSKREKFFVTYRERATLWRRVTISLDYRNAPDNSLEIDLLHTKFQRDKSAKIYEAIRESLVDIQFYDSVTNLKLQTTDGRLHVHVVEDVNEVIHYPTVRMIEHLRCRRVKERDIDFDSHMSGFVYKVRVNGETLIKKEIPGPDTVDEFLYEINALSRLRYSHNVIQFYGVIVDDKDEYVKGLLISYAEQGALIDVIFDNDHTLPWTTREKWARQIVEGLSDIHEAGFVQGDFTLSNIVIDHDDNAKIIDINRRGCPVGWEPPEATPLIDSNQRISMYIGVKSDLYQLGMVLWALALQEDEPESHGRPLVLGPEVDVPHWYRTVVETCLAEDPRLRAQAVNLLGLFPDPEDSNGDLDQLDPPSISVDDGTSIQEYFVDGYRTNGGPKIRTVQRPNDWSYVSFGHTYVDPPSGMSNEPYYFPTRGRSPPSPGPSNRDSREGPRYNPRAVPAWKDYRYNSADAQSISDIPPTQTERSEPETSETPKMSRESVPPNPTAEQSLRGPSRERVNQSKAVATEAEGQGPPAETPGESTPTAVKPPEGGPLQSADATQDADVVKIAEVEGSAAEPAEGQAQHPQQEPIPLGRDADIVTDLQEVAVEDREPHAVKDGEHIEEEQAAPEKPLFHEAGTTEPAVQNNRLGENMASSLAGAGAQNQENESASGEIVSEDEEAKQDSGDQHVSSESAAGITTERAQVEPTASPRPPSNHSSTSFVLHEVPDDLRGCGSAYDASNEEAIRKNGVIDEDDMGVSTGTTVNV
ncbi:Activated CDC42 kinase 1 [Pleurostoma richardsiae]|uniref:Activated CDC42 kinase 1 n=1 Tax=Pleurostoma richardsiae TaxID=41990 RepID=A0AA38RGQ8_9PEZI|nr:Activated CDC42 kinase 1 [Pleurostoma richardsiae]